MIANPCVEIQTSEAPRPAVPPWLAEVTIIVQYLATKGLLDAFAHKVRLIRGRFGRYEPIDFLALLLGYAISGERTREAFCARVAPFGSVFMALFGRRCCPHRASLSRFLADVDRPCLEAFRTLFQQFSFAEGWTRDSIGGIFDRQGRRFIVFDVDATRQAARQRALPTAPELPAPRRRLDAVCAPGYMGRKRGEVVRSRTTALQMHTRQWIATYSGKGNGDYREERALALQAVMIYLEQFSLPRRPSTHPLRRAIWRCGGHRPNHAHRRASHHPRQSLSTLRAARYPASPRSSTDCQRCEEKHWRGRRAVRGRLARFSRRAAIRSGDCDPLPGFFSRFSGESWQARGGMDLRTLRHHPGCRELPGRGCRGPVSRAWGI